MSESKAASKGLNVGLHAQTLERADGLVAGSEVTTRGLQAAFGRLPGVKRVTRYGPGAYGSLEEDDLDLLIIEGWASTLQEFIRRARGAHPGVKVLFWNLSFFGIREIAGLDVDGYLTNSRKVAPILEKIAPTKYLMLAADPEEFKPVGLVEGYGHDVTYLGLFHARKSAGVLERMLYEARDFGLTIYGHGWGDHPVLRENWMGKLPSEDIARLYSSAKVVLGITEDRQRAAGMINNRVFEALACGACLISEYYPALEEVFGDTVLYSRRRGDTARHIESILEDGAYRRSLGRKGRELILMHHTYDHRVEEILSFYRGLCEAGR
jgi:glycosyltransferase involved in cell wall biosynthesis